MKDYRLLLKKALMVVLLVPMPLTLHAIASIEDKDLSSDPKIQKLLQDEAHAISQEFPFRMNLFTQGQITRAKAGTRYAETAKQFATDNSGLLFFYDVLPEGMRVPHWHANAKEVGTVVSGKMRVTIWDGGDKPKVFTVDKNSTWIIPKSTLHALENVGKDTMKFVVSYDSPIAADKDFLTAWTSLPDAMLAKSVGLKEEEIASIKKTIVDRLSKFDPAAQPDKNEEYSGLSQSFLTTKPLYQAKFGSITRIDGKTTPDMNKMGLQRTVMKPGAMRIPHWYTSGDVLLFVYKGIAFFTMMDDEGKVYHNVIRPGDVVSIPIGNFHSFINIGKVDLEIYEAFNRADEINEITLANGVKNLNAGMIQGATGLSQELIKKIKDEKLEDYITQF